MFFTQPILLKYRCHLLQPLGKDS